MAGNGWFFTAETQRTRSIVGGWLVVNVNVKVKESWEIEGPVGLAPAERGPTELCVYDYVYDSKAAGQVKSGKRKKGFSPLGVSHGGNGSTAKPRPQKNQET